MTDSFSQISQIKTLRQAIQWARQNKVAIGHFNISNLESLHAITKTAKKLNVPVIIGVSEGERDAIGVGMARAMVTAAAKELDHPIFLNGDHTYSFERVTEAIHAGFDSVIIDAAKLTMEENIHLTKKSVDYAKAWNQDKGADVLIEGELGYIGQSSKVLDKIPDGVGLSPASLTQPDDVAHFVASTGLDLIAPAVGNVHGMIKGGNPKLNIERIAEITQASPAGVVLHGASGIGLDELQAAVEAGVCIVHYNTELRVAFTNALKVAIEKNPEEITPYKLTKTAADAVAEVVEEKLRIMNKIR